MEFYKWLNEIEGYRKALDNPNEELVNEIDDSINSKFKFRPYQKKALSVFDWIVNKAKQGDDVVIPKIKDPALGDFPIYGFEMATGSGKTILIGAYIIYLHEKHNIKNFLILTPPRGKSAIYDKTIRNFDFNSKDCVLSNSIGKKFNLITGDNYTNKSCNYNSDADFNIFVLNINKFFESSAGVKSVDKPWEESFWKDNSDSVISFREFLKQIPDLVIITDEAHHFQKYSAGGDEVEKGKGNSAGDIVRDLAPCSLIEFTATMVNEQKPIFRYSVNDYISDRYGKKVRAWGINTNPSQGLFQFDAEESKKKDYVSDNDAAKIVRAIAAHMIKKIALKYEEKPDDKTRKPILLVKARNTDHAENVCKYIKEKLPRDTDAIEKIFKEITKDDEYEINKLIKNEFSGQDLVKEIEQIGEKTFSFHTKNETKEVQDLFNELDTNNMEIIIQVDKATEGWNIDNVYSILILSNNEGEIKTNVRQLIGRGLRLFREQRMFDESEDPLKKEEELLHVICEQGNNFAKFVEQIRAEIGFSSENFSGELKTQEKENKIDPTFNFKFTKLTLPLIKRESELKIDSPEQLIKKLNFKDLELIYFVNEVSNPWIELKSNGRQLKWGEQDISQEGDLETGKIIKSGTATSLEHEELCLTELDRTKITKEIIKNQNLLPSDEKVDEALRTATRELTDKYSFYFKKKYGTDDFWRRQFSNKLIIFLSKKIDMYFEPKTVIAGKINFKDTFKEHSIVLEYEDGQVSNVRNINQTIDLLNNKREIPKTFIMGYKKAYFIYNKFDSSQELKLAELLDKIEEVEVWVKNKRFGQFIMQYGLGRDFSPDFIVKLKDSDIIYIIEVKAESLRETSTEKIMIMRDTNALSKGCVNLFLEDTAVDSLFSRQIRSFKDIIQADSLLN